MSQVQKCPVCEGKGLLPKNFYTLKYYLTTTTTIEETEKCKSCDGKGFIIVLSYEFSVYKPIIDNTNKIYDPCENCSIRQNPNWDGICHCALPYFINPFIRW